VCYLRIQNRNAGSSRHCRKWPTTSPRGRRDAKKTTESLDSRSATSRRRSVCLDETERRPICLSIARGLAHAAVLAVTEARSNQRQLEALCDKPPTLRLTTRRFIQFLNPCATSLRPYESLLVASATLRTRARQTSGSTRHCSSSSSGLIQFDLVLTDLDDYPMSLSHRIDHSSRSVAHE
jgi:hypothetical protein